MVIVEKITAILQAMTDDPGCELNSWQYNRLSKGNVRLDTKMPSPTALFVQISDWKLDMNRLAKRELAHISVSFLNKTTKPMDGEGVDEDAIVTDMCEIALDFIQRIRADRTIRIDNDVINLKSVFYASDSNRVGVTVELDIEEVQGSCI